MKQETRERAGTVLEIISLVFTILFIVIDLLLYFFVSLVNLKVEFGCIERSHATADLSAYGAEIRSAEEEIMGTDYDFENNTEETSETTSSQERHEQHIPGVSDEGKKLKIIRIIEYVLISSVAVPIIVVVNWCLRKKAWILPFSTIILVALLIIFTPPVSRAPIIYLYPEEETEVNVQLELNGELGTTYPHYNEGGWTVTASPDGTLTDTNGREYSYLFWEGSLNLEPDLSQGFCVKGEDTAEFLEWALKELGLNDIEADTFIMYWLPQMEGNKYNVISFQTTAYEDAAALYVTPAPDTEIRVNMLWYSSLVPVDIEEQDLASINPDTREGFTVVEWGGEEYERGLLEYFLK